MMRTPNKQTFFSELFQYEENKSEIATKNVNRFYWKLKIYKYEKKENKSGQIIIQYTPRFKNVYWFKSTIHGWLKVISSDL